MIVIGFPGEISVYNAEWTAPGRIEMSKKPVVRHRSAKTGKYVTQKYAKNHPDITVRETDKPRKKGK